MLRLPRSIRPDLPRGITVVELMVVMAVLGVLATLTLPSFQAQIRKARRADAYVAMAQVQQAQERHRSSRPAYAPSLTDLGVGGTSAAGHYRLSTSTEADTHGHRYVVAAEATGAQAADVACKHLRVVHDAGVLTQQSGPTAGYENDGTANRACWHS